MRAAAEMMVTNERSVTFRLVTEAGIGKKNSMIIRSPITAVSITGICILINLSDTSSHLT
jgi:hypothetical protein